MTEYSAPKGVCFYAYNNDQLDYVRMALLAGKYVKKYLNLPVCLITDEGSEGWLEQSNPSEVVDEVFDYIVVTNDEMKSNARRHYDLSLIHI